MCVGSLFFFAKFDHRFGPVLDSSIVKEICFDVNVVTAFRAVCIQRNVIRPSDFQLPAAFGASAVGLIDQNRHQSVSSSVLPKNTTAFAGSVQHEQNFEGRLPAFADTRKQKADGTAQQEFASKKGNCSNADRSALSIAATLASDLLARDGNLRYSGNGSFISNGFISNKEKAMSSNGVLINHCGASAVSKEDLQTIEAPEATKTWYPVRHRDVLTCVEETLDKSGFQIRKSQLSVSNNNHRFFGVLDIEAPLAEGVTLSVGVRNSNDKSFPIGFCVGNRTFVCDNLAFSSEVVIAKRHTRFGNDRYQEGVAAAIERLNEYRELETQRILTLQSTALPDATAESVVLRAWEKGIVGTRLLRPLLDEWRKPTFDEFQERTAWALLAAFTHIVKPRQRRYPNRTALDVMQFQSLLTT